MATPGLTTSSDYIADLNRISSDTSKLQSAIVDNKQAIQIAQQQIATNNKNIADAEALISKYSSQPSTAETKALIQNQTSYIESIKQNITQQQTIIDKATNNISVNQTQIDELQLYQQRDQETL
jgi:chromosome segregation ATPase